jgi:ribosomal protein L31E
MGTDMTPHQRFDDQMRIINSDMDRQIRIAKIQANRRMQVIRADFQRQMKIDGFRWDPDLKQWFAP